MQTPFGGMVVEHLALEERDRTDFKKKVNQLQVELCEHPESLEKFHIQDTLFSLNKKIAHLVQGWNIRLQELTSKKKEEKRSIEECECRQPRDSFINPRQSCPFYGLDCYH